MRKYITQATERRINEMLKADMPEGNLLNWALDEIKGLEGWQGATIKEAKGYGVQFDAYQQISGRRDYLAKLNGWASIYPDMMGYSGTLDLNTWTIWDFNGLVSLVYADRYLQRVA